ncbi:Hypothetical predicted protein [Mytilus galloprovincialis]|uniref:Potassium channel tetramerisation-type BTB domain-containing protein n=1 Tax=Mytilus galloprovincialis TaxID=29158 RepID=A0A8B6GG69_MYTGA|nr:Hypothetical predicted protein [Mytilus galloprovincialis]
MFVENFPINIEIVHRQASTPPKRKIRLFVSASRGRSRIRNSERRDSRGHIRSPVRRRWEEPVPSVESVVTRLVGPVCTSQTSNVSPCRDTRIVQNQSLRAVAATSPPATTRAMSDSSSSGSSELSIHAEAGGVYPPANTRYVPSELILLVSMKETIKLVRRTQENKVVLSIGGTKFETSKETLSVVPGSSFWTLCQENLPEGPIFLDRDPTHFITIRSDIMNMLNTKM